MCYTRGAKEKTRHDPETLSNWTKSQTKPPTSWKTKMNITIVLSARAKNNKTWLKSRFNTKWVSPPLLFPPPLSLATVRKKRPVQSAHTYDDADVLNDTMLSLLLPLSLLKTAKEEKTTIGFVSRNTTFRGIFSSFFPHLFPLYQGREQDD